MRKASDSVMPAGSRRPGGGDGIRARDNMRQDCNRDVWHSVRLRWRQREGTPMIGRFAVTFLLLAVPAFGQARVYTNADLGKIQRTHNATEEELSWLRAHQFVAVPDHPAGPEVIVVHSSTAE